MNTNTNTHTLKSCPMLVISVISAIIFMISCSPEEEGKQRNQNEQSQAEKEQVAEGAAPVVNGLALELSLAHPKKRWVRVEWKNIQDADLILTLSDDFTFDDREPLTWPCFHFNVSRVPDRSPYASFTGFATINNEPTELIDVLILNGTPLYKNNYPAQLVKHVTLKPGEVFGVMFDLGSLFEGTDNAVDSVKVWFSYTCLGRDHEGDMYWRGVLKSNILEIKR